MPWWRDLFPVEDNAKVFSALMLVLSTSPLIAPTAGGYIIAAWGWHSVFYRTGRHRPADHFSHPLRITGKQQNPTPITR